MNTTQAFPYRLPCYATIILSTTIRKYRYQYCLQLSSSPVVSLLPGAAATHYNSNPLHCCYNYTSGPAQHIKHCQFIHSPCFACGTAIASETFIHQFYQLKLVTISTVFGGWQVPSHNHQTTSLPEVLPPYLQCLTAPRCNSFWCNSINYTRKAIRNL